MFRTIRALVIAGVVAASLLGSASAASADPGHGRHHHTIAPSQITILGITWE
jgi:hypothetical protein